MGFISFKHFIISLDLPLFPHPIFLFPYNLQLPSSFLLPSLLLLFLSTSLYMLMFIKKGKWGLIYTSILGGISYKGRRRERS